MNKELVIQSSDGGADIALLENKRLVELHHEESSDNYLVGDVFLGRVRKVLPALNAAFIDIGHDKDAFLHYHDLGPDVKSFLKYVDLVKKHKLRDNNLEHFRFEPQIIKTGKIEDVLLPNQNIVVQIVKEPISTKGPRLTSLLTLSGRYLILMPFSESISISKKIRSRQERDRLEKIVKGVKPQKHGIIIRTNAENAKEADLVNDLKKLINDWDELVKEIVAGKNKLYSELDRTESILRDLMSDDFNRITVDNNKTLKQVKSFLSLIAPGKEDIVKLHKGEKSIFDALDVDKQIRSLFGKIVNLGGGAYLIIEHTEAMHVIDVNSGSKRSKEDNQEENALKINIDAANEIARQLRLRDMGGIVVVDFIDVKQQSNKKILQEKMQEIMTADRAKHTILPLTKFGLMQITRQRVRPELNLSSSEPCTECNGTGQVTKGVVVTEEIERVLRHTIGQSKLKKLIISVHPYVHAYLTKGFLSTIRKWSWKYKCRIRTKPVDGFMLNQYEIE